jgi:radical SAM superfamily enzyme YgiQ (UPF0313 family)
MLTPGFQVKPVHKVLEEIRAIKRVWPRPFIEFADDNTFVNKTHAKALMRALAPERIRWFTETDIAVADDPELLTLMREAGCVEVLIGLESPHFDGLEGVELRRNWKQGRVATYHEAIERIQSAGITVNGCFVLGMDMDGPSVFDDIATFVEESGLFEVQVTVLTPLPGSALYDRFKREGRLIADGQWNRFTLFDVTFEPASMPVSELETGLVELGKRLYTPEARQDRQRSFRAQARRGRRLAKQV